MIKLVRRLCGFALALGFLASLSHAQAVSFDVIQEQLEFPAVIENKTYRLQAMLYRPEGTEARPLVVFSHGRNGQASPYDPKMVEGYRQICSALARRGYVVAYIVRRGYGDSDGPDSELKDTAVQSGLEAAKDYKAAVQYWAGQDFVLPDKVVVMGQSQGGWAALACTNVDIPGLLGAVNISGGTNFRLMSDHDSNYAHWVTASSELGRGAHVPAFWIHAENDLSIPGATARRMYDAFIASGGTGSLLMLPPYGRNGHAVVEQPSLFMTELVAFLDSIGARVEPAELPGIVSIAGTDAAALGGTAIFSAQVAGNPAPALQWQRNGVDLEESPRVQGTKTPTLILENVTAADAGNYRVTAINSSGYAVSDPVAFAIGASDPGLLIPAGDSRSRIVNLSTRGIVATGENVLIAGFVIAGAVPKKLLIFASGLAMEQRFNLAGSIGRPHVAVHRALNGTTLKLTENDNWQADRAVVSAALQQVGVPLPSASADPARGDAALVLTLEPGAYTAVVSPATSSANQDGIGLIEVFDLEPDSASKLVNISSRGRVETGSRQMIVGVVTRGPGPSRLLLRAVGPSLERFELQHRISNPVQALFSNRDTATPLGRNDDWWLSPNFQQVQSLMPELGAFAFNGYSADSAILILLHPGGFTSVVSNKSGASGVVLSEIYDANPR